MVTLYDDAADSATGGYPDIVVLVFGYTADVIVAKTLFLCQVVQVVSILIENVKTFTRTNPD